MKKVKAPRVVAGGGREGCSDDESPRTGYKTIANDQRPIELRSNSGVMEIRAQIREHIAAIQKRC